MPYNYDSTIDPYEVALDVELDPINIAELLEERDLIKIGSAVVTGYDEDEASRYEWWARIERGLEMAMQIARNKTYPWHKSSNVQYPSLSIAALNFHARALPALLPPKNLVTARVMGKDQSGEKREAAERVNMHMTYQLRDRMPAWEEDHDRLLLCLSITGSEFKKTYYDPLERTNVSRHLSCRDLVVNYWSKDIDTAPRVTEVMEMSMNEVVERQRLGQYRDIKLGDPVPREDPKQRHQDKTSGTVPPMEDDATPYMLLEQHRYMDLDNDGYQEPYTVVIEYYSGKVLSINARYRTDNIEGEPEGQIFRIKPINYYTHYIFLPSPDGSFYGMGFGLLLGSLNRAINTLTNQLIDAGTMSNLQSGFLSKNLQIDEGEVRFKPGEWKWVNALGRDLREGVFPLPVREPSNVLFELLSLLINSGQQLSSTTDIMVGENPGQNQKATTTMAVVENGLKVITAIYKRIRRAMEKEYRKLFTLNKYYMEEVEYFDLLDWDTGDGIYSAYQTDYDNEQLQITPTADPNAISQVQRMLRAEGLMALAVQGVINMQEAVKEYLDALDVPQKERFLNLPQPQPDFEQQVKMQANQIKDKEVEYRYETEKERNLIEAHKVDQTDKLQQAKLVEQILKNRGQELKNAATAIQARTKQSEAKKSAGGKSKSNK